MGNPDPAHVSTSYVERQSLTVRMSMRGFTRPTNGFSKKINNHFYAPAIHYMHYNFCGFTRARGPHLRWKLALRIMCGLCLDCLAGDLAVK
jgi:hypothetical protein